MARQKQELKVFLVDPHDSKTPPTPGKALTIAASNVAGLLSAAEAALRDAGHPLWRSISYTPQGLVAYVETDASK